jgi:glutamate 5-kinase
MYFRTQLRDARRVVVKIGSSCLVEDSRFRQRVATNIASGVAALKQEGRDVLLVSSGAVALGKIGAAAHLSRRVLAARGQRVLAEHYARIFSEFGLGASSVQIDVTDFDGNHELREALLHLSSSKSDIGLFNQNDFVRKDDLNNDALAAVLAQAISADALVLLSDVAGLMDRHWQRVPFVDSLDRSIWRMVRSSQSSNGHGGIASKLRVFAQSGIAHQLLANGVEEHVLARIFAGEDVGTLFALQA